MERKAGETIGGYIIVRKLGAGAFADVYLARDPRHGNRPVALKVIREDSGEAMEERGASLLRQVNHANIVKVYYVGHVEGRLTVVMEYVPGKTLREMLHTQKTLPESRALAITLQIADALTFLHELRIDEKVGVAHLDLKPSNILVEPDDHTRITDFSTSRLGVCGATTSGCGSPAYMAPEQFLGHPVLASDIWAMGVLLYEMLVGQPFFRAASVEDYKKLILGSPGQWAAMTSPLPAGIRSIILRCVAHFPQDRFPTARELADRLRDQLDGFESLACEKCGATLPEDGACPLCGQEATGESSRRDPSFWPSPTLTGGGPSGRTDLPLAGSSTGIPDWANRSIETVADLSPFRRPAAGTLSPAAGALPTASPRPAQVLPRRKKGSRIAAFSFFLVLAGVGAALWFLLGPSFQAGGGAATAHSSRQTTVSRGAEPAPGRPEQSTEGARSPVRSGVPGGNPGLPDGIGEAVHPVAASPAPAKRAPDIRPWPSSAASEKGKPPSRPESADASSVGSRVVPGAVAGAMAASGSGPAPAEVLSDSALPEAWWPEEDFATRLERIRSLERTPAGSYDDRIRLLDGFIAECGDTASRAQAQALLRVWKWEKNEFARAEAVDRAKGTRISEALEAWRDFFKSARTMFRKGYAEGRLQFWSDKLRSYNGSADVRVVAAARLPRRDMRGGIPSPPDAYFVIKQNERQVYRSRTLAANEFPVWNEAARVHLSPGSRLTLEIWDEDPLDDDLLLRFQINPVPEDGPYTARAAGASVDIVIEREQ